MNEQGFTDALIAQLEGFVAPSELATKTSVLYSLSLDDKGNLQRGVGEGGEVTRGGGTGFEQDILVFERVSSAYTNIVPRMIAEVKFGGVTTHDTMVYSEKARRIRMVYPYVRYGMLLGNMPKDRIPPRVIRLGSEFDFIVAIAYPIQAAEIENLGALFRQEIAISKDLALAIRDEVKVKMVRRHLGIQVT